MQAILTLTESRAAAGLFPSNDLTFKEAKVSRRSIAATAAYVDDATDRFHPGISAFVAEVHYTTNRRTSRCTARH